MGKEASWLAPRRQRSQSAPISVHSWLQWVSCLRQSMKKCFERSVLSLYLSVDESGPSARTDPFPSLPFLFTKPGDWGWQYLNTIITGRRGSPSFRNTTQAPRGLYSHTIKLGPEPPKPYSLSRAAFRVCHNLYALVTVLFNVRTSVYPISSLWECLANSKCLAFALRHIVVKRFNVIPLCKHPWIPPSKDF